ncbi:MAG: ribonuclease HII [Nitrospirales bacterium]
MGPTDFFEQAARACGFRRIAGLDEAGRGPLAGPVVAAIVMLPRHWSHDLLDDSKLLSEHQSQTLYEAIATRAFDWAIGMASEQEIDELNILGATRLASCRAIEQLSIPPDYLLLDALHLPTISVPQRPVIKGDQLSRSIATQEHLRRLHQFGPCPGHRRSFRPVRACLDA